MSITRGHFVQGTRKVVLQKPASTFKKDIIDSVEAVALASQDGGQVWIDFQRLNECAKEFAQRPLELPRWNYPAFPNKSEGFTDEQIIGFMLLGNTINFCYTDIGTKKKYYTVSGTGRDGKPAAWQGAEGMWASLKRAIKEGIPVLDGQYLANITIEQARGIFERPDSDSVLNSDKFSTDMPMLEERVRILREAGSVLNRRYDGSFYKLFTESRGRLFDNGNGLIERLIDEFPSFRDIETYNGRPVALDKRAQLAVAMLHEKLLDIGLQGFPENDIAQLTVFVNYNLPRTLRELGVINYREPLANLVDNQIEIPYGSRKEVEIRAVTLCAANRLEDKIREIDPDSKVSALYIDFLLWAAGRKLEGRPHHLSRTTAY